MLNCIKKRSKSKIVISPFLPTQIHVHSDAYSA